MNFVALILLTLLPSIATAQLYKCKDAAGKIQYSDKPCQSGSETRLKSTPQDHSLSPRADYKAQLDEAIQKYLAAGDIDGARRLAQNLKHWGWIAEAERNQAQQREIGQETSALQKRALENERANDAFLREKETRHTVRGWERKSRAEWIAEDKRKEAEAKAATAQAQSAAVATDPTTLFDQRGNAYRKDGAILYDQYGNAYHNNGAGVATSVKTGKPCFITGQHMRCH